MSENFASLEQLGFSLLGTSQGNQEQIAMLKEQGVKAWNEWKMKRVKELEKEKGWSIENRWSKPQEQKEESRINALMMPQEETFDLRGANLLGLDLTGVDFSGTYLEGANLEKTILSNANLEYAYLQSARLNKAILSNASVSHANLGNAALDDANFSGTKLAHTNIFGATVYRANLSNTDLTNADLTAANLTDVDLSNANLTNANLNNTTLTNAKLTNVEMPRRAGELRLNDLKALPIGTQIGIVYHTKYTKDHGVRGDYRGVQDGVLTLRVYRTVNYGNRSALMTLDAKS